MDQSFKRYIKELLLKEDERYRLIQLGFFSDIDTEVDFICKYFQIKEGEGYPEWKSRILREYYRTKGFSLFCRNHIDDIHFEKVVKSLMGESLYDLFKSAPLSDTDKYLALSGDTLTFSLSDEMFDLLYYSRFSNISFFGSTKDLKSFCGEVVADAYPLGEPYIVDELKKNVNFYWSKVYLKLRPMVAGFSYKISGTIDEGRLHDMWSDACCTLNTAVVQDKLEHPTTAKAIISYAAGIIKNKNKELLRARKKQNVDIDAVSYNMAAEDDKNVFDDTSLVFSENPSQSDKICNYIDVNDSESVRSFMVVVLYNQSHPLHNRLVDGYQDKVKILFEHYLDNLSYEELVNKYFGTMTPSEMKRSSAKMRQDVKRLKERLVVKFNDMIKEESR